MLRSYTFAAAIDCHHFWSNNMSFNKIEFSDVNSIDMREQEPEFIFVYFQCENEQCKNHKCNLHAHPI